MFNHSFHSHYRANHQGGYMIIKQVENYNMLEEIVQCCFGVVSMKHQWPSFLPAFNKLRRGDIVPMLAHFVA